MINYSLAEKGELEAISQLLQNNHLPYTDIHESPITFIVAKKEDTIVGCIGLEQYGSNGLLRSFAVKTDYQKKGIGRDLCLKLLSFAVDHQITSLHLLTTTARDYFERAGFVLANRKEAPEGISKSSEFASLCPASSTYMLKEIVS